MEEPGRLSKWGEAERKVVERATAGGAKIPSLVPTYYYSARFDSEDLGMGKFRYRSFPRPSSSPLSISNLEVRRKYGVGTCHSRVC